MYVRAGRPAFARSCVGVHKSTSLMSSSPASNLNSFRDRRQVAGTVGVLSGVAAQDLFKIARNFYIQLYGFKQPILISGKQFYLQ